MESIDDLTNTVTAFASLDPQQKASVLATCIVVQFLRQSRASQIEHNSYFEVDIQRVDFVVNRALAWLASLQIKGSLFAVLVIHSNR